MSSAASTSNTVPMKMQEQDGEFLSWCDLPSDLFGKILCLLPCCKDGVHLSAVCRHWRACARQMNFPRRRALPMRVTRTARGTHVVHVRGFSWLQEQHLPLCRPSRWSAEVEDEAPEPAAATVRCVDGFVDSPVFAVGGLDWAIRYYPGSDDGGDGLVGVFVRLLTESAVAWAYVRLVILDQKTNGFEDMAIMDDQWPMLFDAASAELCTRGSGRVATRSGLKGSPFVRADCLKIECVVHVVSRDRYYECSMGY